MDPWLKDLVSKLPLAIVSTILTGLIIKFWKKLVHLAKQLLGLTEPPKEQISHSFPEGEIAHCYAFRHFRTGFTVAVGWRGAIVDKGVVQRDLGPGRYRRGKVRKLVDRLALSETARVILWRDSEFPVVISLDDLFAADHQSMQLEMQSVFRFKSAHPLHAYLEEITLPLEHIAKHISERVALPMRKWVASLQGEDPYLHRDRLPEWSETAKGLVEAALSESPFEIVRVTDLRMFSPELDQLYSRYGELAKENASARTEIERNKVRGSLRQAMLEGKLDEIQDQSRFEDAVRVIEHEKTLKGKALARELAQSELTQLEESLKVWKRKREVLLEMLEPAQAGAQAGGENTNRVADNVRRVAVDSADSPFSAHERQQICSVLQGFRNQGVRPEEIVLAIAKGAGIPPVLFDPLARIRGPHTLHVGEGWRVFDGENLWQIRLTRIDTRRHGFFWHSESPAQAHFEIRSSPDHRRFEQNVVLNGKFLLEMGKQGIPAEYLEGTPSRISLRI